MAARRDRARFVAARTHANGKTDTSRGLAPGGIAPHGFTLKKIRREASRRSPQAVEIVGCRASATTAWINSGARRQMQEGCSVTVAVEFRRTGARTGENTRRQRQRDERRGREKFLGSCGIPLQCRRLWLDGTRAGIQSVMDLFFPAGHHCRSQRDVYSVSRLNKEVRLLLESGLPVLWLEGELSNFAAPASGHWYFSLKDSTAQVRCAMWRQRNTQVRFRPKDGMAVLVRARVGLYEPRGEYQLLVEHLEEAGEGALKREFEKLKARLAAEGLFAAERKRPLPAVPRRIGVVSSPTGAAIHDILRVLRARFPAASVLLYPTAVQGAAAVPEIVRAIETASRRNECDVLIIARGGGSLEDLWCFNDERVARAIAACRVPTVSGVGHEVDVTIADFVADLRAPTPSAAALAAVPDKQTWLEALAQLETAFRRRHRARVARAVAGRRHAGAAAADLSPGREARATRAAARRSGIAPAPGAARHRLDQAAATRNSQHATVARESAASTRSALCPCRNAAPTSGDRLHWQPDRAGTTPRARVAHARRGESARDAGPWFRGGSRVEDGALLRDAAQAPGGGDRSAPGAGPVARAGGFAASRMRMTNYLARLALMAVTVRRAGIRRGRIHRPTRRRPCRRRGHLQAGRRAGSSCPPSRSMADQ